MRNFAVIVLSPFNIRPFCLGRQVDLLVSMVPGSQRRSGACWPSPVLPRSRRIARPVYLLN